MDILFLLAILTAIGSVICGILAIYFAYKADKEAEKAIEGIREAQRLLAEAQKHL